MRGRLAFPLHNASGALVAYTGFKLDKNAEGPLWLLPKDFDPALELIGYSVLVERMAEIAVVVITFDLIEAAYAAQSLGEDHFPLAILSGEISAVQEQMLIALINEHGFAGTFLVLAAPSDKSGAHPALVDQAILRLARLAPTRCVVLT